MERQVVLKFEEYESLLAIIKSQAKTIKELEEKSFIIHVNHSGQISYVKNAPENVSKIYEALKREVNNKNDLYYKTIESKNHDITFLKMRLDSVMNNIKTQVEEYNKQGGFGRMVYPFILKEL